jgi:hypothetical protein
VTPHAPDAAPVAAEEAADETAAPQRRAARPFASNALDVPMPGGWARGADREARVARRARLAEGHSPCGRGGGKGGAP